MEINNHIIDLLGNKYGRLLVTSFVGTSKHGYALWKCLCDCGNETTVSSSALRRGYTRSCGCLHKESLKQSNDKRKLPWGQAAFNSLYHVYKQNAKAKKKSFELTKEDFSFLTKMNCFYCGCPPKQVQLPRNNNGSYTYNGIDRLDSTEGYTMDNVVPCCGDCNYMKRSMTVSEFKERILEIVKYKGWINSSQQM